MSDHWDPDPEWEHATHEHDVVSNRPRDDAAQEALKRWRPDVDAQGFDIEFTATLRLTNRELEDMGLKAPGFPAQGPSIEYSAHLVHDLLKRPGLREVRANHVLPWHQSYEAEPAE